MIPVLPPPETSLTGRLRWTSGAADRRVSANGAMAPPDWSRFGGVTRRNGRNSGCAVAVIGLLAGVAGAATTVFWISSSTTYHYSFGSMLDGVSGSSSHPAKPADR